MSDAIDATEPWLRTTLGEVVAESGGVLQTGPFGSQLHASDYSIAGTPLIMPTNLGDNAIREDGVARVNALHATRLRRHALREGDIVFSRRGDVGRRSIVRQHEAGWLCGTGCLAAKFGPRREKINPEFVAVYLGLPTVQTWLLDNAVGGTMPNLNTSILSSTPVQIPTRVVQDAIITALGDASSLLVALERLIAKKQAIKQGIMQQLLTGRTRLPGFEGAWTEATLGSVAIVTMGQSPVGATYNSEGRGLPLIQGNADIRNRVTVDRIWTTAPTKRCAVGDVLLTVRAPVGYTAVASKASCLGRGVCGVSAKVDNRFLFHALVYAEPAWAEYEQGSTFTSVGSRETHSFTLRWPSDPEERTAIATVLDDIDNELEVLHARLAKATAVKQGMMQELLTGRTQLAVEAVL